MGNSSQKTTGVQFLLLAGIFIIIIITLILLLVYVGLSIQQFTQLEKVLADAFTGVISIFNKVADSVVTAFTNFVNGAISVVNTIASYSASAFGNAATYLSSQLVGISNLSVLVLNYLVSSVGQTIVVTPVKLLGNAFQMFNSILSFLVQIQLVVLNAVGSVIVFIISFISKAIDLIVKEFLCFIKQTVIAIELLVNEIIGIVNQILNILNPF